MKSEFTAAQLADPDTAVSETEIRKCVHCGFCLATCPTYVLLGDERDSPRGRIYLIKDMLEGDKTPTAEVVKHVDRCLSCLACETTCPSGVSYRRLIDQGRHHIAERYRRPLGERWLRAFLAALLPHPGRFGLAVGLGRLTAWVAPALIPAPLRRMQRLAARAPKRAGAAAAVEPTAPSRGRVALLRGCAEPVMSPQIQAAAARLLGRAGFDVVRARGEGCCGALTHHLGKTDAALAHARRNVDAWTAELDRGVSAIVVTASGCGSQIKDYGHLLRGDAAYAAKAARVSAAARDVCELLAEVGLPPVTQPAVKGLPVACQSACSLQHGQRVAEPPKQLLRVAGFAVTEPAEAHLCCGSAGTYNITQPELSEQLRVRKLEALRATGARIVASGNIGCIVQLGGESDPAIVHTVELLDWACGGPRPEALAMVS